MKVTDKHIAFVRALMTDDIEAFDHLGVPEDREFAVFVATVFTLAARAKFADRSSRAEVIRYIGRLRAQNLPGSGGLEAEAAEDLLCSALSGSPAHVRNEVTAGYAQVMLVAQLASGFDQEQVHMLISDARIQADQWLAQHPA